MTRRRLAVAAAVLAGAALAIYLVADTGAQVVLAPKAGTGPNPRCSPGLGVANGEGRRMLKRWAGETLADLDRAQD